MNSPSVDGRLKMRILVGTASSIVFPGVYASLLESRHFNFQIFGMDARIIGSRTGLCENFFLVPMGSEIEPYIERVKQICAENQIDVILSISDEENTSLSLHRETFAEMGVITLTSSPSSTRCGFSKACALRILAEHGLDTPAWRSITTRDELVAGLRELGYPKREVVFKPASGRGSRGFWIVSDRFDRTKYLFGRERVYLTKEWLLQLVGKSDFKESILMEYLPGESYSIDILADHGHLIACLPHLRLGYRWGRLDEARISPDPALTEQCSAIVKALDLHSLVNIELGRDGSGTPKIIEVNPRASATIALNRFAGFDMVSEAIRLEKGERIERFTDFTPVEYTISDLNMVLD